MSVTSVYHEQGHAHFEMLIYRKLECCQIDMATMKARDLRRLAEDWGCEASELLVAEEDEQPKVAIRRLVLATWLGLWI